jgi:methylated-DNA-[protein]-cysteine S-methyltransferase
MAMPETLTCHTSWGNLGITAADGCIIAWSLPPACDREGAPTWKGAGRLRASAPNREVLEMAEAFVRGWFEGTPRRCPPLALSVKEGFLRSAWEALIQVPWGQTVSYTELAAAAGSPRAARAAGSACATNQIPLFIPCHRVLAANRRAGGFGSGLPWKKFLLATEGVAVDRIPEFAS